MTGLLRLIGITLLLILNSQGVRAEAVAAAAPETVEAAAPAASTLNASSLDDVLKIRDPFKRPILVTAKGKPKGDLELFAVEQFKLVGVITGPSRLRAMVEAPNGKTYFVSERQKIGQRNGVVRKITPTAILVRETMVNVVGKEEEIDFEIRLPEDSTPQEAALGAAPRQGG
jgi:Tfp pilus assembly protein PilP